MQLEQLRATLCCQQSQVDSCVYVPRSIAILRKEKKTLRR